VSYTQGHYDLLDAFAQDACPVCRLTLASVTRYINAVNYESAGDPGIRQQLRASLGFCNEHGYQWLGAAHVLGTAQIYIEVLGRATDELRGLFDHRRHLLAGVASFLGVRPDHATCGNECSPVAPTGRCLVCVVRDTTGQKLVSTVVQDIAEPSFLAAYVTSAGLCLPHLRLALCRASSEEAFRILRDTAIAGEARLRAQLQEIVRKHDYRFSHQPSGEERGAGDRAVHHVAGAHGIGE
jgi:hypothetical protein